MRSRAFVVMPACLVLAACGAAPVDYPPPIQRDFGGLAKSNSPARIAEMADASSDYFIARDIQMIIEGGSWRWTHQQPELRFLLTRTTSLSVFMDFTIVEATFRDTGPVSISYFINGRLLEKARYAEPGDKKFTKAVPAAWLRLGEYNTVGVVIDPVWVSPANGTKFGIVLRKAGFIDQ